jgi:hypothetical protein
MGFFDLMSEWTYRYRTERDFAFKLAFAITFVLSLMISIPVVLLIKSTDTLEDETQDILDAPDTTETNPLDDYTTWQLIGMCLAGSLLLAALIGGLASIGPSMYQAQLKHYQTKGFTEKEAREQALMDARMSGRGGGYRIPNITIND